MIPVKAGRALRRYDPGQVEFVQYLPEAHLVSAVSVLTENSPVQLGSQGVYRMNTAVGGNFGAFTTNRPASIVKAMSCSASFIPPARSPATTVRTMSIWWIWATPLRGTM